MAKGDFKRFVKGHKALTIFLSFFLVVIIAAVITGNVLYYGVFTVPLENKEDRVSEGYIPSNSDLENSPKYKYICIFGVDGAGGNFSTANTPNFDHIFQDGSINENGVAEYPTISAQNWASMMLGVNAQKHQYTNEKIAVFPKIVGKYPTFFKIHSEIDKEATFLSVVNWRPINTGLVEVGIRNMTKHKAYYFSDSKDYAEIDKVVAKITAEQTLKNPATIAYMHFDNVDEVGHMQGGPESEVYKNAISGVDACIGTVYSAYEQKGIVDDTLFICVTDHGHREGGGHGGETPEEKAVTLAVWGGKGDIKKGTSGKYVSRDLASIVLYALGDKQPDYFDGRVPYNLFNELE